MNISGISANDGFFTGSQIGGSNELSSDDFLELLVAQLGNQDPLEPLNNENFMAQMTDFSSLDQLEELNTNIVTMIALNQSNAALSQLTQGSALIGKEVRWSDPSTGLTSSGSVESVKVQNGTALLNIDGQDVPLGYVNEILDAGTESESDSGTDSDSESN